MQSKIKQSRINTPGTWEYMIARAQTHDDWRSLNDRLHRALEQRIEEIRVEGDIKLLDTDEELTRLNTLCTLTHEVMRLRNILRRAQQELEG